MMDLCEHFGLNQMPFTRHIAPGNLYPSGQFTECTARLQFIVDNRVFGVITGEVGAGKSTALRKLRHSLNLSDHRFLYLARSSLTPRDLYRELLHQLDVQPPWLKSEAQRLFDEKILELHRQQKVTPVVVIDEAHLWDTQMLEEVRFLTNFGIDAAAPMALVLTGQPELREHLKFQKHTAIRQRAEVWFHLEGMGAEETQGYIQHQLKTVGGDPQLFTETAIQKIHRNTQGIPRRINNRCRAALLDTYMRDRTIVEEQSIERVISEFATDVNISN